jgi:hypothetical protein
MVVAKAGAARHIWTKSGNPMKTSAALASPRTKAVNTNSAGLIGSSNVAERVCIIEPDLPLFHYRRTIQPGPHGSRSGICTR